MSEPSLPERAAEVDDGSPGSSLGPHASCLAVIQRNGLPFNSATWARIVVDCYGFEDCSVDLGDASLSLFCTWSPLFGKKLVTAVFNGYASPIFRTTEQCRALLGEAIARAQARRASLLEIKALFPLPAPLVEEFGLIERRRYRSSIVDLGQQRPDPGEYSANFRSHLRRAHRKVAQARVAIERTTAIEDLQRFHGLMLRRYRDRHRMIGQPLRLFELIHDRLIATGAADLWVAKNAAGDVVAGILFLISPVVATAAFGASHEAYRELSVDAVLKDLSLSWYAKRGVRLYDLGISSPKQQGLLFAKSRWGGLSFELPYYYRLIEGRRISEIDFADAYPGLRALFRWVPLPLVARLSSHVVKYLN